MSTRKRSALLLIGLVLLAAAATWFLFAGKKDAGLRPERKTAPIPVKTEQVRSGDLAVYLNALGNVTAFNTVTVKTRVGGELMRIAFKEGQTVRQGDLLAEIDPRPYQAQLDQAQGKITGDRAQLDFARLELDRDKVLIKKDYIPLSQMQTQSASVNQLLGTIASDQGAIDSARLQLSFCHIQAPLSGRIGLKMVDQGNILNVSDPIVVITQLQPISVIFSVPQDQLPALQRRMKEGAALPVDAFDRDRKNKLAIGQLWSSDNLIDTTTGTLRLKAVFDNQDGALFPNQFVNIRLLLETRAQQILAPRSAVQQDPQGFHVFVVKPDNTVTVRQVSTGPSEGDFTVIAAGLEAGENVVTDGLDKLREGSTIRPPGDAAENTSAPAAGAPERSAGKRPPQ
ncbi:efflux RND transporter periplasmic adaptor subunit [Candidatus Methylospira mobilis]|uniref:Efflux RND transporter periplasmic adaptor subunit n=1 Tax=Candidatus Methylospira mobilis TaxID=1808979 RepID=A0A5Q0BDK4_9GAMM|nr:efflux RND transporter periplasmic adaptor subunit [Candidatus Methylospira mobilis]QFY41925.1 efflux RND transporter periplasmic adaptor subunit [Candidatus Methylospira mobilis]WNV02912.1 efflux RND transporter periplasmic adaptor subunit [Candidatus Methylospira mobilis]